MELFTITLVKNGVKTSIKAKQGHSLMNALADEDIYIPAMCGGKGTCGKCKVQLLKGALEITGADRQAFSKDELKSGLRLSCTAYPSEDITVKIDTNEESEFEAVTFFSKNTTATAPAGTKSSFSIAVDIGTTTIALALVDTANGEVLDNLTAVNKQRAYGADVISRIQNANEGKLTELTETLRTQLIECINRLCDNNAVNTHDIQDIVITANTVMIHLLLGLSCETLGIAPFTPVTLEHIIKKSHEIFGEKLHGTVHILPGISTYVGADITAGLYFSDFIHYEKPAVFLDIGTNGEIAVKKDGAIVCAATAAGPAFEGGNISNGTGSVVGAICEVRYDAKSAAMRNKPAFEIKTISGGKPIGICGSGVIDIVAESLRQGLIDESGRLDEMYAKTGLEIAVTDEKSITFSQKDIRELQLGKSAIRSGLDTLLAFAELEYDDIGRLFIAGGFGFHINIDNGIYIGLLPEELKSKITVIGNSSLGGAVKYLTQGQSSDELSKIIKMSKEHSLPSDKLFSELYMENMTF